MVNDTRNKKLLCGVNIKTITIVSDWSLEHTARLWTGCIQNTSGLSMDYDASTIALRYDITSNHPTKVCHTKQINRHKK